MAAGLAAIDIVLPAHDEGASLAATLREFHRVVRLETGQPTRFVVCEDGSSDDTVPVLQKLAAEHLLGFQRPRRERGVSH